MQLTTAHNVCASIRTRGLAAQWVLASWDRLNIHCLLVDANQNYNNHFNPPHSSDYQRRWVSEQEINLRSRNHRINASQSHPIQTDLLPAPIAASADFLRSNSLQSSYRPSSEIPNWNSWDVDNDAQLQRFNGGASAWATPLNVPIPQFTSQQFDNMLFSASDTTSTSLYTPSHDQATLNGYSFPHRLSPVPSPSPSPVFYESVKQASPVGSSASHGSRRSSFDRTEPSRSCSHCHATSTPLWRRDPSTMKPLCNACGLYLQQRNKLRPQELIDADDDGSTSDESDVNYVGPECSHCRTHHTSVWRRSKAGDQLCNACGVYARLRGKPRPLSLKRNKIRPRSKHLPKWMSRISPPTRKFWTALHIHYSKRHAPNIMRHHTRSLFERCCCFTRKHIILPLFFKIRTINFRNIFLLTCILFMYFFFLP